MRRICCNPVWSCVFASSVELLLEGEVQDGGGGFGICMFMANGEPLAGGAASTEP